MGVQRGRGVDVPGVGEEAKRGVRAPGQALGERRTELFSHHSHTSSIRHENHLAVLYGDESLRGGRQYGLAISYHFMPGVYLVVLLSHDMSLTLGLSIGECGLIMVHTALFNTG